MKKRGRKRNLIVILARHIAVNKEKVRLSVPGIVLGKGNQENDQTLCLPSRGLDPRRNRQMMTVHFIRTINSY